MLKNVVLVSQADRDAITCLARRVKQFEMQLLCVSLELLPQNYSSQDMQVVFNLDELTTQFCWWAGQTVPCFYQAQAD